MKKKMKIRWKKAGAFLLALALLVPVCAGNSLTTYEAKAEVTASADADSTSQDKAGDTSQEDVSDTDSLVQYVAESAEEISSGETQQVSIGIGDNFSRISGAQLSYEDAAGNTYQKDADSISENGVLFSLAGLASGTYTLVSVAWQLADGNTQTEQFADLGISASFGVDASVDTDPDLVETTDENGDTTLQDADEVDSQSETVSDEDQSEGRDSEEQETAQDAQEDGLQVASVSASAEDSTQDISSQVESAVEAAVSQTDGSSLQSGGVSASKTYVVVLDPGHGGNDSGTYGTYNGKTVFEKNLNLKIALACKAELEQYKNVKVYMTRTTDAYMSSSTASKELKARCDYAKKMNADLYVSIHLNAASSKSAHGAMVFIPNTTKNEYGNNFNAEMKEMAEDILAQLKALGITNDGVRTRDYSVDTDGTVLDNRDYYAVIRHGKENNIPSVIVEHAFLSNESDYEKFLSSDSKLAAIGQADAAGIAEYLGLGQKSGTASQLEYYSPVFDPDYYYNAYPDVAAAFGKDDQALLNHFLTYGMKEGRQGCSSFNVTGYKNRYQDLRLAFGDNLPAYYQHYIAYGQKENRDASYTADITNPITTWNGVDYSAVYDFSYYYANQPDVAKVCGHDDIAVLQHFVTFGMKEGRQAKESFNVTGYKNRYVDLRLAFGSNLRDYYIHYMTYGQKENRDASYTAKILDPLATFNGVDYSPVYDFEYYYSHYSSLQKKYGYDDVALLKYFVQYGMKQGNQAKSTFNVQAYKARYSDLRKAFGSNLVQYYLHYIQYGQKEHRSAV